MLGLDDKKGRSLSSVILSASIAVMTCRFPENVVVGCWDKAMSQVRGVWREGSE